MQLDVFVYWVFIPRGGKYLGFWRGQWRERDFEPGKATIVDVTWRPKFFRVLSVKYRVWRVPRQTKCFTFHWRKKWEGKKYLFWPKIPVAYCKEEKEERVTWHTARVQVVESCCCCCMFLNVWGLLLPFSPRYKKGRTGWLDGFTQVCGDMTDRTGETGWGLAGARTDRERERERRSKRLDGSRVFLPGGHRFWENIFT